MINQRKDLNINYRFLRHTKRFENRKNHNIVSSVKERATRVLFLLMKFYQVHHRVEYSKNLILIIGIIKGNK